MQKLSKLNLKEWAAEDRPREKMKQSGARALTNAELLAILIHTGNTEDSVVALTQKIMASCRNSLSLLGKLSVEELCSFKGIGEAKAITILAACELGRRRKEEPPMAPIKIQSSKDAYNYFYPKMVDLHVEECHVIYLNRASVVIDSIRISVGGVAVAAVDTKLILREALLRRASAVVMCHNHPSGSPTPSLHDDKLTENLKSACAIMQIPLMDHIIFTESGYYSYADRGTI